MIKCDPEGMTEHIKHFVLGLRSIDPVTAWKAMSIALTGAFGILGLLKDFKNKHTNKVTIWGWVSLFGIIVSSVGGIVAQLKESSDNAAQALALAKKADTTLTEIERGLSTLEEPKIGFVFDIDCDSSKYATFCTSISNESRVNAAGGSIFDYWNDFPGGQVSWTFTVGMFINPEDAQAFIDAKPVACDWCTRFVTSNHGTGNTFRSSAAAENNLVRMWIVDNKADIVVGSGNLKSVLDLPGATVVINQLFDDDLDVLNIKSFILRVKNGQWIQYTGPFTRVKSKIGWVYIFKLPNKK